MHENKVVPIGEAVTLPSRASLLSYRTWNAARVAQEHAVIKASVLQGITSSTARAPSFRVLSNPRRVVEDTLPMAQVVAEIVDQAPVFEALRAVLAIDDPRVEALKVAIAQAYADDNAEMVAEARS
jgi:hypothetical protein